MNTAAAITHSEVECIGARKWSAERAARHAVQRFLCGEIAEGIEKPISLAKTLLRLALTGSQKAQKLCSVKPSCPDALLFRQEILI
jgi:hypothetical protein